MRRLRALLVVGVGSFLCCSSPVACANPPDMLSFEIDSTRTISAAENGCGFDTVRNSVGTFYVTVY